MTTSEVHDQPLEYGNCVLQLLDEDDGKRVRPHTLYRCVRQDESCEEEAYATGCSFTAYNDESGVTCIVDDGRCQLVADGLRDERYIDYDAERHWRAFRMRTFGLDVAVEAD